MCHTCRRACGRRLNPTTNGNGSIDRIRPKARGRSIDPGPGTEQASFSGFGGQALTVTSIDYAAVFQQFSGPVLLLTPEFVVADANQAYLDATGRTRDQLLGRNIFAAFPDNPSDAHASSVQDSKASLSRVLATGKPDFRSFQRYDVEVPGRPGVYETRYWNSNNAPVFGPDGRIVLITHQLEEITERVRRFLRGLQDDGEDAPEKSRRRQRRTVPAPRAGNGIKSGDRRQEG